MLSESICELMTRKALKLVGWVGVVREKLKRKKIVTKQQAATYFPVPSPFATVNSSA